jgi:cytochrome c551/c552
MKKLSLAVIGAVFAASTVAFVSMGGWAVVTVLKIPDAWVAGKPLILSWQVRQHGVSPLAGLHPVLEARSGSRRITGTAGEYAEPGWKGYRGTITFPQTGVWQVTINSGFGNSKAVLVPWRVVDSVRTIRGTVEEHLKTLGIQPFGEAERGRRMFAATGCVTCHTHGDVPVQGQLKDFGPDLTNRSFPAAYLAKFLANPAIKPPTNGKRMPNLGLRQKDIEPLIAFINSERRVTKR